MTQFIWKHQTIRTVAKENLSLSGLEKNNAFEFWLALEGTQSVLRNFAKTLSIIAIKLANENIPDKHLAAYNAWCLIALNKSTLMEERKVSKMT